MNFKYLPIFIAASLLVILYGFSGSQITDKFEESKKAIIMRQVGHDILLHSGDSTSRVLPVKKIAENGYKIQFASQFTFKPDSLVKIIHRTIDANHLPSDYIVNVVECASNETIFGYAILESQHRKEGKQTNIIPCRCRQQAKGCYLINITFQDTRLLGLPKKSVTAGVSLFALLLIFTGANIYHKKKNATENEGQTLENKFIRIGKFHFYSDKQYLIYNNEQIELTHKESKLLYILASTPNEIIDRTRLQKEIWEDEGIIVGRSLDVFISKLRKKLEIDPNLKILVIRGKGYKLEVSS